MKNASELNAITTEVLMDKETKEMARITEIVETTIYPQLEEQALNGYYTKTIHLDTMNDHEIEIVLETLLIYGYDVRKHANRKHSLIVNWCKQKRPTGRFLCGREVAWGLSIFDLIGY